MGNSDDQVNRTYKLPLALAERVGDAATKLGVWPSDFVGACLTHALDDLAVGRWRPVRKAVWFTLGDDAGGGHD